MSREVLIITRDDLDGSKADQTLRFTIRDVTYEIDLSEANVELFDKSVQQFVDAARPIAPVATTGAPMSRVPIAKRDLMQRRKEIRGWASRNGWPELTEQTKGRIPYDAIEAYQLTHPEVELPPEIVPRRAAGPVKQRDDLESISVQDMLALGDVHDEGIAVTKLLEQPDDSPQKRGRETLARKRREMFGDRVDSLDNTAVRNWAIANGFSPGGGMVSTAVLEAYFAAHPEGN